MNGGQQMNERSAPSSHEALFIVGSGSTASMNGAQGAERTGLLFTSDKWLSPLHPNKLPNTSILKVFFFFFKPSPPNTYCYQPLITYFLFLGG